jgi:hypothetical protein
MGNLGPSRLGLAAGSQDGTAARKGKVNGAGVMAGRPRTSGGGHWGCWRGRGFANSTRPWLRLSDSSRQLQQFRPRELFVLERTGSPVAQKTLTALAAWAPGRQESIVALTQPRGHLVKIRRLLTDKRQPAGGGIGNCGAPKVWADDRSDSAAKEHERQDVDQTEHEFVLLAKQPWTCSNGTVLHR